MTDLSTSVGNTKLGAPILTASGTAGSSTELARYMPLGELGAVVVKSMNVSPTRGNPSPRLHPLPGALINSVGLQGPSVSQWLTDDLPQLEAEGARVVASIWGNTVEEFAQAAALLENAPSCVVAIEANVSCPNLQDHNKMFAHSPEATAEVVEACVGFGLPIWAKLSPNVADICEIALAAHGAGAEAVVLTNTLLAMAIDAKTLRPTLGAKGGGLSGGALRPVAVRATYDVFEAKPDLPIVGAGGVATAAHAVEFFAAGACAVEVGTATFADPRAAHKILGGLRQWCEKHEIGSLDELIGIAHLP